MLITETSILDVLGRNMRHYRRRLDLSQDELADKALLHRSYVGAVERGKRNICMANLVRIAEALEVEPCQLLMSDRAKCRYIIE
ncbi:MAG: helix-turn-helix transcriptional regulator [bacterium]|nr:helix-turn-helix transcriptional regulator [bacterium]